MRNKKSPGCDLSTEPTPTDSTSSPAITSSRGPAGIGLNEEFDMQRYFRDSRSATIAAGTSQAQRNLLANLMGLKSR